MNTSRLAITQKATQKSIRLKFKPVGRVEHGRAKLQFLHEGGEEKIYESGKERPSTLAERTFYYRSLYTFCANAECSPAGGTNGNEARYKLEAIEEAKESYNLESTFSNAYVWIAQEKAPELSFNESESLIDGGRANVLYGKEHFTGGSEPWLGPDSGAFEVKAHDPGIGISWGLVTIGSWRQEELIYKEGKCVGVQCPQAYSTAITYNPSMPEGEQTIQWYAKDLAGDGNWPEGELYGLFEESTQLVKVDAKAPYNIEVGGWPRNREISAAPHTLTVEATDGSGSVNSSGVRSIAVSVDGGPGSSVPNVSCTLGPCTVKGKWTLEAEDLTEGVHRLVVTATDNAGNVAAREFQFDVRHGSPVSVGPGTVDPTTGQLKLSATDVSLAGAGDLSRTYESRNLTAGVEGPLGPQWTVSMGAGQGMTVLPTGSVVLTSPTGGTTTFTRNTKGEYESPLGDGNIKIEPKEKEPGKGITEYLLQETVTGATTTFKQPTGTELTAPVYSQQLGLQGTPLNGPSGIAIDSEGNEWIADTANNRILEFSSDGVLSAAYGSYGEWEGNFISPRAIAINSSTAHLYVIDEANNRIVELGASGEFLKAFGWGVSNGKAEFEVCSKGSYCHAGLAGSGLGQLKEAKGIAIDTSGNLWVSEYGNDRVQEFSSGGEYKKEFGTKGSGVGQVEGVFGIAISGGNLYVSEYGNNRIQEFTTSGTALAQYGKEGTGNREFKGPRGITADPKSGYLYVTDSLNGRVQELKPSGEFVAKFGTTGTGGGQLTEPRGVAVSASGGIYVTDTNNNRIEEWTRPAWLPTISETGLKSAATTYTYEAVEVEGKMVIEPIEELAAPPAKVTCGTKISELKKGCRALSFKYDTEATGAKGLNPGEWGTYKGYLTQVRFHAWDPSKGEITEPPVAEYEYDSKGRLRAEWDPRISPALRTTYGYDEEGHVTSVNPPGQEPWLLHYGSIANEPSRGRLLSATRPAAGTSTLVKEQRAMGTPTDSVAPKLSTTSPAVGTTLSVSSEGTWTNTPLAYSYQWYDCASEAAEWKACIAIVGATNKTYTPQAWDAGYHLLGRVGAQNSSGVTYAGTAASKTVPLSQPSYSSTFGSKGEGSGQLGAPSGEAIDANGNVWVTDPNNSRIDEFSAAGSFMATIGWGVKDGKAELETCTTTCRAGLKGNGRGQFNVPYGIAVNRNNNEIYVGDTLNDRIEEFTTTGSLLRIIGSPGTGAGQLGSPAGMTLDTTGNLWVADFGHNRVQEFSPAGTAMLVVGWGVKDGKAEAETCTITCEAGISGSGNGQFSQPQDITFSGSVMYVIDHYNHRVEKFSSTGIYMGQFGSEGTGEGQIAEAEGITTEQLSGDLYVSEFGPDRVQIFSPEGQYIQSFGKPGSEPGQFLSPTAIAATPTGEMYVVDGVNDRVEKWKQTYSLNNPAPEPPSAGINSIWTIDYQVPLVGTGLPTMTESEVSKWAQKDYPIEGGAMAIFPPDKPMGWPAKEYERATINYIDQQGHTVNVAAPTGGVTTTEYNETNDVTRMLSADNRAIVLKEAKPAEASEKLDTRKKYEKNRLVETLGPETK